MNTNYIIYGDYWGEGYPGGQTVHEQDEVQVTKLLGPDGQPYAIRRPKMKLGFDLTTKKH